LSDAIVILWLLERIGVLNQQFIMKLTNGDMTGCIAEVQAAVQRNFTGAGIPITIASGAGIGTCLLILRYALKNHAISLRKPKAIAF